MFRLQSGKLVTRMFQKIQDLIDDKDALVFVLIDEVGVFRRHTVAEEARDWVALAQAGAASPCLSSPRPGSAGLALGPLGLLRAVCPHARAHPADHPVALRPQVESLTPPRNACRAGTEPRTLSVPSMPS